MSDLAAEIGADISELRRDMRQALGIIENFEKDATRNTNNLGDVFKGVFAGTIVADFAQQGIRAIREMVVEGVHLADVMAGVEPAFERLGDPLLLKDLVDATGGAVTNLNLMKQAVQANNLGLPIQTLANLFQAASIRARETGESVDFLTNSIVTGIGRKSPLILDNLGISAAQLKEELGGVSVQAASIGEVAQAVGNIFQKQMGDMGGSVADVVSEADKLKTAFTNIATEIGAALHPAITTAQKLLADWLTEAKEAIQFARTGLSPLSGTDVQEIEELTRAFQKMGDAARAEEYDRLQGALALAEEDVEKFSEALKQAEFERAKRGLGGFSTEVEAAEQKLDSAQKAVLAINTLFDNYETILNGVKSSTDNLAVSTDTLKGSFDKLFELETSPFGDFAAQLKAIQDAQNEFNLLQDISGLAVGPPPSEAEINRFVAENAPEEEKITESLIKPIEDAEKVALNYQSTLSSLFQTIFTEGTKAKDILAELATGLIPGLLSSIPIVGPALGGIFGGTARGIFSEPGSVILSNGDIRASIASNSRTRDNFGGF